MPAPPAAAIAFGALAPSVEGDTSLDWHTLAALVRARFDDDWPTPSVAVYYENENAALAGTPAPFLTVEIVPGPQSLAGFGGGPDRNLWLETGAILIRVFVARNAGVTQAYSLLDDALDLFRDQRLGTAGVFRCAAAAANGLGSAAESGNYWQVAGSVRVTWNRTD